MIDCETMGEDISALHDGEPIERAQAEHIAGCERCRQKVREYAELKSELRLLAARTAGEPPPLPGQLAARSARRAWWAKNWRARMLVPRFAAVLAALAIIALSVSLAVAVHARDDGPWFQFSLSEAYDHGLASSIGGLQSPSTAAQGGGFMRLGTPSQMLAIQLRTVDIRDDIAHIEVRARAFPPRVDSQTALAALQSMIPVAYTYTPGEKIAIRVEGSDPIYLVGRIFTYRPAQLVELNPRQMATNDVALKAPVLLRDKQIIWEGAGGTLSAGASGKQAALAYYVPGEGRFLIALEPFENAVEAEVNGSQLRFQDAGIEYRIFSKEEITGGDQPRHIWVRHEASYLPSATGGDDKDASLVSSSLRP